MKRTWMHIAATVALATLAACHSPAGEEVAAEPRVLEVTLDASGVSWDDAAFADIVTDPEAPITVVLKGADGKTIAQVEAANIGDLQRITSEQGAANSALAAKNKRLAEEITREEERR